MGASELTTFLNQLETHTGKPARGLWSVTVIHADGALADAASTALFVAGPQRWREVARRLGVEQVVVVADGGAVSVTAALAPRLHFAGGIAPQVVP